VSSCALHRSPLVVALALAVAGALAGAPRAAAADTPVLARGERGAEVRFYQGELNTWLAYARPSDPRIREDGIFGPRTEEATRDLERAAGIVANGIAERETWAALYRLLGRRATRILAPAQVVPEWPLPLPQWFWPWARWYLHRAEFADEPLRSAASRPGAAPARVPEWAWRRIAAIAGRGLVARADLFVEDRVQRIFGDRLDTAVGVGEVTVTPQRRSEVAPGWILATASLDTPDGETARVAAWLRLVRGRWVPWEIGRLDGPSFTTEPRLVPCDLKPAFAESFCPPAAGNGPAAALEDFHDAARTGDAGALFSLLAPKARERVGPFARFRQGTATALSEGLGSFPADTPLVLATGVGGGWAVAALAGPRRVEGTEEHGVYAAALRRVDGAWRLALFGPVAVEPLRPAPGATVARVERVAVRATAPGALERFDVWLDGQPFTVEVGGPSASEQTAFAQPREPLAPGRHVVVAFARTGDSATARGWEFTVAD
jgi:hypothetical protein